MISFEDFFMQDEADKYNMLQECNAIIQQKDKELEARKQLINKQDKELWTQEHIIKEVREYIEKCSILGVNEVDSYCMDYDVRDDLLEILDKVDDEK